jgi:hypothetical protein
VSQKEEPTRSFGSSECLLALRLQRGNVRILQQLIDGLVRENLPHHFAFGVLGQRAKLN